MLPKTPLASKPSADQQTYAHGDFEDENYIGGARSGRFKECFYQQIASAQTTDCVSFMLGKNLARHSGCFTSLEAHLSRSIHSAEKAAEVSRQRDDDYGHSLDRQAVSRQDLFLVSPGFPMDEPHHTDQGA